MKAGVLGVSALLLFAGTAAAQGFGDDWEERNRTILEMDQVNRGDYTYQILPDSRIVPRCDAAADRLRRRRDPRTLRFPYPCGDARSRARRER